MSSFSISIFGFIFPNNNISISTFGFISDAIESDIIIDYEDRAESLVIEQLKNSTLFLKLLKARINICQQVEYDAYDLISKRNINLSFGKIMDDYPGQISGVNREGRTDEEYRNAIIERNFINLSFGSPESVINAVKQFTGSNEVHYYEGKAEILLYIDSQSNDIPDNLRTLIENISPAGISINIIVFNGSVLSFGEENGYPPIGDNIKGYSEQVFDVNGGSLTEIFF